MYTSAIKLNGNDASLQANRAATYTMMNLIDKVIQDCQKGIDIDPTYTKCYSRILKAFTQQGQFDKGLLMVVKAKENKIYDDSKGNSTNNNNTFHTEIKEFQKIKDSQDIAMDNQERKNQSIACNQFNSLKDTCTRCDRIWLLLIECLIDSNKSFEAKEKINKAIEMFPRISSDINFIFFDALSDYFVGDLKNCKSKLERVKLNDGSYKELNSTWEYINKSEDLKTKGNECFKNGKSEEAVEFQNQCLLLDSRNIEYNSKIYSNRSACKEQLKKQNEAYDDICEAIELNPTYAKAYLRRGNILQHLELYQESLADYNKAKQLDVRVADNIDQKIQWCNNKIKITKKKDLQAVLGVTKEATEQEVNKAWRKKSLLLHPDRMVGKSRAEKIIADKELRDLNEAHDVVTDKNKRAQQDTNGFDEHGNVNEGGVHMGGFGGMDMNDIISSMFGGGGGLGGQNVQFSFGGQPGGSRRKKGGGSDFYQNFNM